MITSIYITAEIKPRVAIWQVAAFERVGPVIPLGMNVSRSDEKYIYMFGLCYTFEAVGQLVKNKQKITNTENNGYYVSSGI